MSDANAKAACADKVRGHFVLLTLQGAAAGRCTAWIRAADVQEVRASGHGTFPTLICRAQRSGHGDLVHESVDEVLALLERAERVRVEGLEQLAFAVGVSRVPDFLASVLAPTKPAQPTRSLRKSSSG